MNLYKYSKVELQEMVSVLEKAKLLLPKINGICYSISLVCYYNQFSLIKVNEDELIELCFLYRVNSDVVSTGMEMYWWPLKPENVQNRIDTIDKAINHLQLIINNEKEGNQKEASAQEKA